MLTDINENFTDLSVSKIADPKLLRVVPLFFVVFVVAVCGIIYELIISACSSFLMGDSIYQFSITIGIYLSAMGIGSFLSKKIENDLFRKFFIIEILVGILGGFSAIILYAAYIYTSWYTAIMILLILLIGTLVGFEIPVLIRILEKYDTLKETVANVLTYDYIGALIGSLGFPLFLLPRLGIIRSSFAVGMLNILVVIFTLLLYRKKLRSFSADFFISIVIFFILGLGFYYSPQLTYKLESKMFNHQLVKSYQSEYQKINITKWKKDIRLFINYHLQFCSVDEYRYHECLVHPAMSLAGSLNNILVLGGGDGLAAREILKYKDVKKIDLVDLDPEIVKICSTDEMIRKLNKNSLENSKIEYYPKDAYKFLEETEQKYDCIFIDLPDSNNISINKLYTRHFYSLVKKCLAEKGVMAVQSTSLFYAPRAFWCINKTIASTGMSVLPYHVSMPSFGDWGFQLAMKEKININDLNSIDFEIRNIETRYLDNKEMINLFVIPQDMKKDINTLAVNTLIHPRLLEYYNEDWKQW
jgi:spermidine synthase